jgi:hypothetical protein
VRPTKASTQALHGTTLQARLQFLSVVNTCAACQMSQRQNGGNCASHGGGIDRADLTGSIVCMRASLGSTSTFVFGRTGTLGSRLLRRLRPSHRCLGLGRTSSGRRSSPSRDSRCCLCCCFFALCFLRIRESLLVELLGDRPINCLLSMPR